MAVAADQVSYSDLYARWERGHWSATALDFTQDRRDWAEAFSDFERTAALWNYAMFFHGEDAVADDLSPFIDAAPREEQKYFLTTQQVDEARHAVFFNRFMHEVVEAGDGTIAGALEATRPELTWGFVKTFEMLHRVVDELRRDRSRTKLAQAVTMYHFVVEATLAQPGQHFISDYLTQRDLLPGFREGMRHVSLDEQRHTGFGVKLLADLYRDEDLGEAGRRCSSGARAATRACSGRCPGCSPELSSARPHSLVRTHATGAPATGRTRPRPGSARR
jgi:ribonucleotide reductase beta subunit family protein with ferritin-like domain